ncbi:MAG: cob(I)yrinic acid a,c-diamide adenosyltransferase [Prevotella sp.]|nr:cob(I)yrinic acid a,c-diamide adenosyltransferase [Prevotella sp.]
MKITKVYTRTGDKGTTSLVGGVRIKKSDTRLEAYGTVDELSAHLGLLAAMMGEDDNRQNIIRIQNNLFNVCTHLATDQSQTPLYPSAHLAEGEVEFLEQEVDRLMKLLPERQGFVLPGGTPTAAQAHVARTVCRRAERRIAALAEVAVVGDEIQQYVNRLSDYLFVLAKIINFNSGQNEIIWQNACK